MPLFPRSQGSATTKMRYSDVCYDIEYANRFRGSSWDDWLGQHSIHSTEWYWYVSSASIPWLSPAWP